MSSVNGRNSGSSIAVFIRDDDVGRNPIPVCRHDGDVRSRIRSPEIFRRVLGVVAEVGLSAIGKGWRRRTLMSWITTMRRGSQSAALPSSVGHHGLSTSLLPAFPRLCTDPTHHRSVWQYRTMTNCIPLACRCHCHYHHRGRGVRHGHGDAPNHLQLSMY